MVKLMTRAFFKLHDSLSLSPVEQLLSNSQSWSSSYFHIWTQILDMTKPCCVQFVFQPLQPVSI